MNSEKSIFDRSSFVKSSGVKPLQLGEPPPPIEPPNCALPCTLMALASLLLKQQADWVRSTQVLIHLSFLEQYSPRSTHSPAPRFMEVIF